MSFPTRPSRSWIGDTKTNLHPVRDPTKEVGADEMNRVTWTLAGCAAGVDRAWLEATLIGPTTISITAHKESWDPTNTGALGPTIARSGAGVYTVTYAATYNDNAGTAIATQLYAPQVTVLDSGNLNGTATVASGRIVTVRIFTANTAAPTDASFALSVK